MAATPDVVPAAANAMRQGLSNSELQHLVDGRYDAAVIVDAELRPLVWNAAYAQAAGQRARGLDRIIADTHLRCRDLLCLDVCDTDCLAKRASGAAARYGWTRSTLGRSGSRIRPRRR